MPIGLGAAPMGVATSLETDGMWECSLPTGGVRTLHFMRFAQRSQRTQRRWCHAANAGPICFAQSHKGTKMSCWPRRGFSVHAAPDRNDGRKSGLAAASQLFRAFVALCETKNKIGRAQCRERVCQLVKISVVVVLLKKKQ